MVRILVQLPVLAIVQVLISMIKEFPVIFSILHDPFITV